MSLCPGWTQKPNLYLKEFIFKREVEKLVKIGVSALISSHILDMVEKFCTKIGIIHEGRLLLEGPIEKIKEVIIDRQDATLEEVFLKIIREEEFSE